jgi:hypothetical protein
MNGRAQWKIHQPPSPEERTSELAVDSVRNYLVCHNFEEFDFEH